METSILLCSSIGWDLPEEWNFDRFANPFAKHKTYSTPSSVILEKLSSLDGLRIIELELIYHNLSAASVREKGKQSTKGLQISCIPFVVDYQ